MINNKVLVLFHNVVLLTKQSKGNLSDTSINRRLVRQVSTHLKFDCCNRCRLGISLHPCDSSLCKYVQHFINHVRTITNTINSKHIWQEPIYVRIFTLSTMCNVTFNHFQHIGVRNVVICPVVGRLELTIVTNCNFKIGGWKDIIH